MQQDSQALQRAVASILTHLDLPTLESFSQPTVQVVSPEAVAERLQAIEPRKSRTAAMAMTREHSLEPESIKLDDALASAPMGSLYEVTKLRNLRNNPRGRSGPATQADDFISKGKVSESEAEELFGIFSRSLNHYLWAGIALVHDNLASVRQSSSLLLAAILTVTALHIPGRGPTFDICYAEFTALVCDSMFERYHVLDGIRGLCIGAFWLSDVSCETDPGPTREDTLICDRETFRTCCQNSNGTESASKLLACPSRIKRPHRRSQTVVLSLRLRPPFQHRVWSTACHTRKRNSYLSRKVLGASWDNTSRFPLAQPSRSFSNPHQSL